MSVMRGVAPFAVLWQRRTTLEDRQGTRIEMLSLPDLVSAKKTQRDKDWPMLRRLVEAHYFANRENAQPEQITFWLRQSRTPSILLELAAAYVPLAEAAVEERPAVALAGAASAVAVPTVMVAAAAAAARTTELGLTDSP